MPIRILQSHPTSILRIAAIQVWQFYCVVVLPWICKGEQANLLNLEMILVIGENVSGSSKIFKLVSCAFIFTRNMHYILDFMYKDAQDYTSCFVAAVRGLDTFLVFS